MNLKKLLFTNRYYHMISFLGGSVPPNKPLWVYEAYTTECSANWAIMNLQKRPLKGMFRKMENNLLYIHAAGMTLHHWIHKSRPELINFSSFSLQPNLWRNERLQERKQFYHNQGCHICDPDKIRLFFKGCRIGGLMLKTWIKYVKKKLF